MLRMMSAATATGGAPRSRVRGCRDRRVRRGSCRCASMREEVLGVIINTGMRTDTVQYYTEWLLRRFAEGSVLVRNPRFPQKVTRYELDPAVVDCVVFCSKDYAPILPRLSEITERFNTYFFYTITAYGRDMEPGVPAIDEAMATLEALSQRVGRGRVVWRYDPVLLSERYTTRVHAETFERMAARLAPYVSRCVFSFVEPYRKLDRTMPELTPLMADERDYMAELLGGIAARHGLELRICACAGARYERYGIKPAGCMRLADIGAANGVSFRPRVHKGMRSGCGCVETRDIGAYDCCPNGCRYCYATSDTRRAARAYRTEHDPASPLILGHLHPGDEVTQAVQRSFLVHAAAPAAAAPGQLTLL